MKGNKQFASLLTAQGLANLGDILYTISIISSIYTLTGSVLSMTVVPILITASMMVAGFVVPIVTARVPLNRILVGTQLVKGLLLAGLFSLLAVGDQTPKLILLYLFVAGISFMDGFAEPVSSAILPYYVDESKLVRANSLLGTMFQILGIGGWAGGTVLLVILSIKQTLFLAVVFSLISFLLLLRLSKVNSVIEEEESQWLSGWRSLKRMPAVRALVQMDLIEIFANTVWISAIVLVLVQEVLHLSSDWWGFVNATYMVGTLTGSLICYRFDQKIKENYVGFIILGSLAGSLVTFFVAANSSGLILLLLSFLVGISNQLKNIPQTSLLQKGLPKSKQAEIYGAMNVLYTGAFSVATMVVGLLADFLGVDGVFIVSAVLLLIVTGIAILKQKLIKSLAEETESEDSPAEIS